MVSRILKRASESVEKRADDNEATIKNRIDTFIKNTDEILCQYPTQTKRVNIENEPKSRIGRWSLQLINWIFILQVDGERGVDDIFNEVSEAISVITKS